MTPSFFTRVRNCVRERRLPYVVERRWYSTSMLPLHRMLLDPQLKRTDVGPQFISLDEARRLQAQFPCRDAYKYDLASKKARAAERLELIAKAINLGRPLKILEVGGGDGQLSLLLAEQGHNCTILDMEDWRDQEVKQSAVQFIASDASKSFPLESAAYDLCVSFNTMEHITDPGAALAHMMHVLKPGGSMYHSFCPLYNSAWGLHAYRVIWFPYPQFLLSPDSLTELCANTSSSGYGSEHPSFVYVNGWHASQYLEVLSSAPCKSLTITTSRSMTNLDTVYKYRQSFCGRTLNVDELVIDGLCVHLTKL